MFYEEKMIDGVMHFRSSPDREFRPMTVEQLSRRLEDVKEELQDAFYQLRDLGIDQ